MTSHLKKEYQFRVLAIGIMLIGLGIYQLPIIWTSKSSLTALTGTLESVNNHISTITDRKGHKSQVSELTFYLNEYSSKFYLAQNIGTNWEDDEYQTILKKLKQADTVTVWVRKEDENELQPKVFQIERDKDTTILELNRVQSEPRYLSAFLFSLGLISIALFLWLRYPNQFKRFFS